MASELLIFLILALGASSTPLTTTSQNVVAVSTPTGAVPAYSEDQLAAILVDRLTSICASHKEVERAFILAKPGEDGPIMYMFIPIFDRDVSDEALREADLAYESLFPGRGKLGLVLLARHTWKRSLGGATPFYVRPD